MPEEQKFFMYQFIKNKLEPFVSPISNTPQAPPQSKEQPSNEGSAPQQAPQQQAPDAPQQQAPDEPQQQAPDAPQQQAPDAPQQVPDVIDEKPLQQDLVMEKHAPNTNIIMNTTRKTARFMANMATKAIKVLDRIILKKEDKEKQGNFVIDVILEPPEKYIKYEFIILLKLNG